MDVLNGTKLTLIVAPSSDHPGGLDFEQLVGFIGERSGIDIEIKRGADYSEAINALRDGSAELGWLGPFGYQEAADKGHIEAFAVGQPRGKRSPNYRSLFITRTDTPIHTLTDARGKQIAIGDPHSTSGYVVPKKELADIGIHIDNPGEFAEIVNVANHDEAIRLVLEGRVDVAPVSSVNFDENVASGALDPKRIRIIHTSPDIPGSPLVYLKSLPETIRATIRELTLTAHEYIEVSGYGGAMERYIDPEESRQRLLESYLRHQWGWMTYAGMAAFIAAIVLIGIDLEANPAAVLSQASKYLGDIIGRMLPPDFSDFGALMLSMLETVEIAVLGTVLAITLSIPIGLFSARNLAPNTTVYLVCRFITVFFRAIPEFIMAMILVIAIGFGAMPGVIALGLHTMGFLAKFYAEDVEHVSTRPVDALSSMGAGRLQVLVYAIFPQVMPSFIGNNLYILDRNIRMATMLGIVGAGGIGYELQSAFRSFEYPRVSAIIIVIFAAIFLIDMLSSFIRAKVR